MVYWFQKAAETQTYMQVIFSWQNISKVTQILGYLIYVYGIFPVCIFKV